MIDTHCHLLAGLDDGPESEIESLQLARVLSQEEVTVALCTPHFSRRYETQLRDALERFERLRGELAALEIALEIELAAEISADFAMTRPVDELRARAIAERSVLVDVEARTTLGTLVRLCERLSEAALVPVFAHPERAGVFQRAPGSIDALRERGAWIQVVAASLTGGWGDEAWRTGWALLEAGSADFVASDAHRPVGRRTRLRALGELVADRCGVARRTELFERGPRRLLRGLSRDETLAGGYW